MPRRVPRVITFQMKRANRRIINQQAFLDMFREFGEVGCFLIIVHVYHCSCRLSKC